MMLAAEMPLTTRLEPLVKGRSLLPIVQGGMGVGISAHRLAGNVARLGAMGTIASVDLRRDRISARAPQPERCKAWRDRGGVGFGQE